MHKILALFLIVISSFSLANELSVDELEVKQRDNVIKEFSSLALYEYKKFTQEELFKLLSEYPIALENPDYVSTKDNFIFFGSTIKFEYKNEKLEAVYW